MLDSRIFYNTLIACCIAVSVGTAHADENKNLIEIYQLAVSKDSRLGQARSRVDASSADKAIAVAAFLPKVNSSALQRKIWHTVLEYGPTPINGEYKSYSYNIAAQWALVNLPSVFQMAASNAGYRSAEASLTVVQQELIVRLSTAYINLLRSNADVKILQDDLQRYTKVLNQAEAALKAGTGDIISVFEAKARLEGASAELLKTEASQRLAVQELSNIAGTTVTAVQDVDVSTPKGANPEDLAWWIDTMQKNNQSLKQAKEDLTEAEYYTKANKAVHLPTFQLVGGYNVDKGSTFLPEVETKQWYAGASISFPIFSGGETIARTKRAAASESERRYIYEGTKDQALKKIKEAYLNLQYNISLISAYKKKLESAEKQLLAIKKGYLIGTRTAVDQLNAEQTWSISKRDYDSSLYDNVIRQLELRAASGILNMNDVHDVKMAQQQTLEPVAKATH